jgi:hypothetical protein
MTWGKAIVAGLLAGIGYAVADHLVDVAWNRYVKSKRSRSCCSGCAAN